jgi:hypothetical protein
MAVSRDERVHIAIRNVELRDCKVRGGGIRGVHLQDASITNLKVLSLPQILGCIFEHVIISGRVNQLMIRGELPTVDHPEPFEEAAAEAYETIDWALDITSIDCPDLDIRGVPRDLIRRDPAYQIVVRREDALDGRWRDIDLSGTSFAIAIQQMLRLGWTEIVLAAPLTGRSSKASARAIDELRAAGVGM